MRGRTPLHAPTRRETQLFGFDANLTHEDLYQLALEGWRQLLVV
jgi:hypothetical protein